MSRTTRSRTRAEPGLPLGSVVVRECVDALVELDPRVEPAVVERIRRRTASRGNRLGEVDRQLQMPQETYQLVVVHDDSGMPFSSPQSP